MKRMNKLIKTIMIAVVAVIMTSTVCFAETSSDGYNGGQQDTDDTHGTADQFTAEEQGLGFSTVATGYRFYIAEYETDAYGYVRSLKSIITPDAVDIYMSNTDLFCTPIFTPINGVKMKSDNTC